MKVPKKDTELEKEKKSKDEVIKDQEVATEVAQPKIGKIPLEDMSSEPQEDYEKKNELSKVFVEEEKKVGKGMGRSRKMLGLMEVIMDTKKVQKEMGVIIQASREQEKLFEECMQILTLINKKR